MSAMSFPETPSFTGMFAPSGVEADVPQLTNLRPVAWPSNFSAAALPSSPALSRSSVNASMPQRVWWINTNSFVSSK